MIEFIVRARSAPVEADRFLASIGTGVGVEYLADIVRHAMFISQGHRSDACLSLVLEKSADFSRVLRISGSDLGSLPDLHEMSLLRAIADALRSASTLGKDESITDSRGIEVTAVSFEHLVKARTESHQVLLMDADGADLREAELAQDVVFVLTEHTPMPKNTFKSMARQGVQKISVGPVMLHTAQCISLVLNEIDRRGLTR